MMAELILLNKKKNRGSKFATPAAKLQAPVERDDGEGAAGRRKWLIRRLACLSGGCLQSWELVRLPEVLQVW